MRLSLTLFSLSACLWRVPALAAGEFHLSGRLGLFREPGFTEGGDLVAPPADSGWLGGMSKIGETPAAWMRNPADGVTRRVGLFTGEEFGGDSQGSVMEMVTESGWARGRSARLLPGGGRNFVPWVANGASGVTWRAGLSGPGFAAENGREDTTLQLLTESGYAWGITGRHRGAESLGQAVWVMDGRTGLVSRAGLYDEPRAADSRNGWQRTDVLTLTESGWLCGHNTLYDGPEEAGKAAWATQASTGVTRRLGFFQGPEYTQASPFRQVTLLVRAARDGRMTGYSESYPSAGGEDMTPGMVSWTVDPATGVRRRIGFHEGEEYVNPANGQRASWVLHATDSGWAAGGSSRYPRGNTPGGGVSWVENLRTGALRRVGLFEGKEFTRRDGGAAGSPGVLTESGWVGGQAARYRGDPGDTQVGTAAWVAEASTGVTRRVGLTGDSFVSADGGARSTVKGITESGWVTGYSLAYREGSDGAGEFGKGDVYWVADARTGVTHRVGLFGPEFRNAAGESKAEITGVTEGGIVHGYSVRNPGVKNGGNAAWMADAATGKVTRLGLTGEEFTLSDNNQYSTVNGCTRSGYLHGYSLGRSGEVPWVADSRTGETRRAGLPGGVSHSAQLMVSEGGVAAGRTVMPAAAGAGRSADIGWVMDMKSGLVTPLLLSAEAGDGYRFSRVTGITSAGVVHGFYSLYRNGNFHGERPFLWTEGLGTLVSEGPWPGEGEAAGYRHLEGEVHVNAQGLCVSRGIVADGPYAVGVFFGTWDTLLSFGPGVRVTALTKTADGKHRLSFHTAAPVRVTIQSSGDLVTWRDGQSMDAPAGDSHMDMDADPSSSPNQYWRLKTGTVSP